MKHMKQIKGQKGIGLLELMLALAIIAVLLIMATRYYQSASVSQQVSTAVDMFGGVKGGVSNYMVDNPGTTMSGKNIGDLVAKGYLPNSYGPATAGAAGINPWGGSLSMSPGTGNYTVTMKGVPSAACASLVDRLGQTLSSGLNESLTSPTSAAGCSGTSGTDVVVQYNY